MNPGRFYMPGYMGLGSNAISSPMLRMGSRAISSPMLRMAGSAPRSMGLFSRITNGIRSVNWGGLLTNANKTLDVVNQAIPLVRQAGPMFNNMRSMLQIAKAFGSETTTRTNSNSTGNMQTTNNNSNIVTNNDTNQYLTQEKEVQDNVPNFFI